jgi:Fungal chitosanase of glycosyl hydrolase group 75
MRWVLILGLVAACDDDAAMMDPGPDAAEILPDAPGDPTAAQLLGAISACNVVGGKYAKDSGGTATVDICGLTGAVFWKADLDVDCDGKMTAKCSLATDPDYMNQTAATDSMGNALDAAALPYVVVPGVSARWSYRAAGLAMGSVVAVIYGDHLEYGILGDVGPVAAIGEASYRMAELLTINPNPSTGGTAAEVAYIAFTGMAAEVDVIEDHAMAVQIGVAHAKLLLGQ